MSQQGCVIEAYGVFKRFSRSDGRIVLKDIRVHVLYVQGWFSLWQYDGFAVRARTSLDAASHVGLRH